MPDDDRVTPSADLSVALVERARQGDADAFAGLYDMYAGPILRYLRARVREPRDAEDLLQATFLRLIEALPRWESRGAPISAWLFRVARNLAIDDARRRRADVDIERVAEAPAPDADPGDHDLMDLHATLTRTLATLTSDQRDVIALRYFADLSGPEIARAIGKDEAAVRALQSRALASLRRAIERQDRETRARAARTDTAETHTAPRCAASLVRVGARA